VDRVRARETLGIDADRSTRTHSGSSHRGARGFRSGRTPVLVATDVAARGLDVTGISHVINFDVPHSRRTTSTRGSHGTRRSDRRRHHVRCAGREERLRDIQREIGMELPRTVVPGFECGRAGDAPSARHRALAAGRREARRRAARLRARGRRAPKRAGAGRGAARGTGDGGVSPGRLVVVGSFGRARPRRCVVKALVYQAPGRSVDGCAASAHSASHRRHRTHRCHDDLRDGLHILKGMFRRSHLAAFSATRASASSPRWEFGLHAESRRQRHHLVHQVVRPLPVLQAGHLRALPR